MKFLSRFFKPKETVAERRAKRKCCQWINKDEPPPTHTHEEDWDYIKNEKKELEKK